MAVSPSVPRVPSPNATAKALNTLPRVKTRWITPEILVIGSSSALGQFAVVTPAGCDCPAAQFGNPCWHLAAYTLRKRHQLAPTTTGPKTPDELDAADDARQQAKHERKVASAQRQAQRVGAQAEQQAASVRQVIRTKTYTDADYDALYS